MKPHQLNEETINQTAQRLMRDKLGFPTPQITGGISHQEVVDIVDNRLHDAHSAIEMRLSLLEQHVGIDFIDDSTPHML